MCTGTTELLHLLFRPLMFTGTTEFTALINSGH